MMVEWSPPKKPKPAPNDGRQDPQMIRSCMMVQIGLFPSKRCTRDEEKGTFNALPLIYPLCHQASSVSQSPFQTKPN
jgi:hypothetical protein